MTATSDAALGEFSGRVLSWRRLMALAGTTDARRTMFFRAVREIASFVARGLDRAVAVDELIEMAVSHQFFGEDEQEIQERIAEVFALIKPNGKDHGLHQPEIKATLYRFPDPAKIPPRQWLHGHHYMRGVVSATVAPGGFGKTTLSLHEALEMANNGARVWYISAEDDIVEINRRIAAYVKRHNGAQPPDGSLFVDDKMSFPFKIARLQRNGEIKFEDERIKAFEEAIERDKIDVVILDPFISFHHLPENDTASMDALVKRLGEIATRRACSIELSHHVRKPMSTQVEITVHDARGAGAIVNAVRSCRVLNLMTKKFYDAQGLHPRNNGDRSSYFRIDNGKRNMAPPEETKWMRLVNVDLANGDKVQALIEFTPQAKPGSGLNDDEDCAWLRHIFKNGTYRKDSQSDNWFGHKVAEHLGKDIGVASDRTSVVATIKAWHGLDWIREGTVLDDHNRKKSAWMIGPKALAQPAPEPPEYEPDDVWEPASEHLPFQVIGPAPGEPCSVCNRMDGDVYLIRDPFRGVGSTPLHERCAPSWYKR
jgi:AAA domain